MGLRTPRKARFWISRRITAASGAPSRRRGRIAAAGGKRVTDSRLRGALFATDSGFESARRPTIRTNLVTHGQPRSGFGAVRWRWHGSARYPTEVQLRTID